MRTFEQSHPWFSFRWEPRRMPYPVWLLLGEAAAYIRVLAQASLPSTSAHALELQALTRGSLALAAMEGNTLTEEQASRCLSGELVLTPAQAYLGLEIQNLLRAFRWTEDRLRAGDRQFSPWSIQMLNAQILKGLPWDEESAPGEYRSARHSPAAPAAAPLEDIAFLVESLCEWLRADRFMPQHVEEARAFGVVRAMLAQLYLLWIRPFAEGNERTAWMITGQLLLEAGAPPFVVLRFMGQAGRERVAWAREIKATGSGHGDPVPFIALLSRMLVDCLREAAEEVEHEQQQALLNDHLHHRLEAGRTTNGARQRKLLMALVQEGTPVEPGAVARINPELAAIYARLDRKTLLRDIRSLEDEGLLVRGRDGLTTRHAPLQAFKPLVKA